jgi:outer membrane immunogenic protein
LRRSIASTRACFESPRLGLAESRDSFFDDIVRILHSVYGGVQIGGAGGHDSAKLIFPDTDFTPRYGDSLHGVKGGFHVGWNYQICLYWVLGLEGTVDGSSFWKRFHPFPDKPIIYSTSADIQGSIRGRSGIAWDRALIYATGGVAFADVRNTYDSRDIGLGFIDVSNTRVGWTAGRRATHPAEHSIASE